MLALLKRIFRWVLEGAIRASWYHAIQLKKGYRQTMIHVTAIITAVPGKRSELLDAFMQIVPLVHAEKGCVEYVPVTDASNAGKAQTELGPDTFMVVEKWETMDDLKAHSVSEHMVNYGKNAGHMVADRVIHILS